VITSAVALLIGVPVGDRRGALRHGAMPTTAARAAAHDHARPAGGGCRLWSTALWGIFVLIPRLKPAEQWFQRHLSRSSPSSAARHVAGPNYFIGGLILAIMILPIVSRHHPRG